MHLKRVSVYYFILFLFLFLVRNKDVFAQSASSVETSEKIYEHWFYAFYSVKQNIATNQQPADKDFDVFTRFSASSIDSLRGDFIERIGSGEVNLSNAKSYEDTLTKALNKLYTKYQYIKREFPSSVEEYKVKNKPAFLSAPCDSACNNIDFESGNLSGWNAYYAYNASDTTSTSVTNITGGPAGPVTEAANDLLTSTFPFCCKSVAPSPSPDYQISITSGTRGDAIIPSIPVVSPFGGRYSVMLGDSTQVNSGVAILSQTFLVTTANANFTYQYAVVLENPSHNYYQQPFFRIFFIDQSGDTIPFCGEYTVVAGNGTQQLDSIIYYDPRALLSYPVYYKNWTLVNVPLKKYIGQCITVVFESGDCSLGAHFGYAYVDASCSPLKILTSSQFFCGQDSIALTGPTGESGYKWTGPAGGIISSDTSRNIEIDSVGTYTLVITPVTGSPCNDTLTINIGKKPGPPPNPNFAADTVCIGQPTSFTNKSNPIAGANFDWDFYNIGNYQDSATNPTWTYNLPGTYTVKLHEEVSGCGTDTLLKVVVDSAIIPSFTAKSVCPNDTMFFKNTSLGAISFQWNFGDTGSGGLNTSPQKNPDHIYSWPGTYNVTLIDKTDQCEDTITKAVIVLPAGEAIVNGPETICSGGSTQIDASGSTTYLWNTGATTTSINVNPATTTSYYCIMKNNDGCTDTSHTTIVVNPALTLNACCDASLSPGQSVQLSANGTTGTFMWAPSSGLNCYSCDNPVASPVYTTTYTVTLTDDNGCVIQQLITIDISCGYLYIPDAFSPGADHNNMLYVRSPCIESMIFMVFDRWGDRVFESKSQDIGWDGHHNGVPMPMDTYVWRLTATMTDGSKIEKKGDVTLVR